MEIGSLAKEGGSSTNNAGFLWWFRSLAMNVKDNVVEIAKRVKKLGKDDPRRIIHSVKVGLTLSLVSLLYYFRPLYGGFGVSTMWAVLTVVVVFEFSVGATLGKGFNRAVATMLAGALGVGAHHLATLAGDEGEPILIGIFVFLIAAAASFSRFLPGIKARYDYGVMIFILTFALVSVSGYRVEKIIELAHQRLSTIIIGSVTCVIISIFVFPVWAGEDLHKLVALNMEKLAAFLQGFGGEYFGMDELVVDDQGNICPAVSKEDKSFLQGYKTVLNSKPVEDALANFAKWEPRHGRFMFRHPWKQYLKIGMLTRQCAYRIEALNSCINSEIQAVLPKEFSKKIQVACKELSMESGKALLELSLSISTMTHPSTVSSHLKKSKSAAENLKTILRTGDVSGNTNILQIIPITTVSSLLIDILSSIESIAIAVNDLACLAKFKHTAEATITPTMISPQTLNEGATTPISSNDGDHVIITICALSAILLDDNENLVDSITM